MFKYNFQNSAIERKSQENKPYNYIDIPNNIQAELYPRRRKTELYFEPAPQLEYQTRETEHPKRALELFQNSLAKSSKTNEITNKPISPPTCSTTRMARDSYFS